MEIATIEIKAANAILDQAIGNDLTMDNYKEKVTEAENLLWSLPQVDLNVRQFFTEGVYVRELTIPKGIILTGGVHKEACTNIVSQGSVLVAFPEGNKIISAPATFVSQPGFKRIGIGLDDCIWATVHKYDGPQLPEHFMKQIVACDTYEIYEQYLRAVEEEKEWREKRSNL
jgi:hypothetical protein